MPVQKQTHRTAHKHVEHQYATYIQNKTIFVFFGFFHFLFLLMIYDYKNILFETHEWWVSMLYLEMKFTHNIWDVAISNIKAPTCALDSGIATLYFVVLRRFLPIIQY